MHSILLAVLVASLPGGLGFGVGTSVSSLAPAEEQYDSRFRTPGAAYGLVFSLDAPGPVVFHIGGEYFCKKASTDWDGETKAILFWAFPCGQFSPMDGFGLFAGPGIVGLTGDYSGTDDFGSFIEEEGSSVGFGVSAGADIHLWGPLSARMGYRMTWIDMKSDKVIKDGEESVVYPAVETDLGYSQYSFTLNVDLIPVDEAGT
ncbi:hypothetical protein CSA37_06045 [Candidatus Fermentibacteria bacterium]|nr:MAG: hypothetical protein CSA37_06045 [Candidatus Fermentibacteria bacterium]